MMNNNNLKIIFYFFLTIIISQHVLLFFTININYLDDDQVIMWLGAKDYSQGIFHEPRFYGQNYSTFMEALIAVPFIWLKMPLFYAVPLATHLIFLTPFIFTAFYLYKHKLLSNAILVLTLLLFMPTGFEVMTSIPRGFVTGVFFTLFFVINLIKTINYSFIFINTLFSIIGFLVNPNSLLVTIPFLFYLFLVNYKNKKYYIYSVLGLITAIPFELLLNQFYRSNPSHVVYTFDNNFKLSYFKNVISNLDKHFAHIGLFTEESCVTTILVFVLIVIYFFKTNKKWLAAFSLLLIILLFSFFGQKISHGGVWPFFSLSRMFIALPTFYMCSIVLCSVSVQKIKYSIVAVVLLFSGYKVYNYNNRLAQYSDDKNWVDLNLFTLKDAIEMPKIYKDMCVKYDAKAIVTIGWTWRDNLINYAGPALYDDYPNTFKPHFERRRWRTNEEIKTVYPVFLIYTRFNNLDSVCHQKYKDVQIKRIDDFGAFCVYNNRLTTVSFLKHIEAETFGF
jgi:hypothetical protein